LREGGRGASGGITRSPHRVRVISTEVISFYGAGTIRYAPWAWGSFDLTGNTTRQNSDVPTGDLNRDTIVLAFTLGRIEPRSGYTLY
jgi:hypothetical protein